MTINSSLQIILSYIVVSIYISILYMFFKVGIFGVVYKICSKDYNINGSMFVYNFLTENFFNTLFEFEVDDIY